MNEAHPWIDDFLRRERLPGTYRGLIESVHVPLADRVSAAAIAKASGTGPGGGAGACSRLFVLGICGTQASGKSTLSASLAELLKERGHRVAVLSIDDLYRTRAERAELARTVHPLFMTRGVPGTHDIALGHALIDALAAGQSIELPAFDKAQDDRRPAGSGARAPAATDILIFEGWCVGARPQAAGMLATPVNEFERTEDPEGRWRTFANEALAGEYQALFARIDLLVLLKAPGFETVYAWRREQEQKLRERLAASGETGTRVMDDAQLARFIAHYERLTRHILAEMPARADVVIPVDRTVGGA